MTLPKFEFLEPKTLSEAANLLAIDPNGTALLAGGTDLLVNMKHRVVQPKQVINLKNIPGLAYIHAEEDGLRIGALTSLDEIADSPVVEHWAPVLCRAARQVGAYTLQVMGTLGGNLCQENRCRYFNQSASWRGVRDPCYKAGGVTCYVVRKPRECHSAYCGDMVPALIALGSHITIASSKGERRVLLKEFYTMDGKKPLSLEPGEIVEEVFVPPPSGKTIYLKYRKRESIDFPAVSLALHLERERNGRIRNAKVIFSGVDRGPVRAVEVEKGLLGAPLDQETIEKVSNQASKEMAPMRTSFVSPAYRRKMAGFLLKQGLAQLSA
jgi:4-hydroxybenzoyl-CoA reductase subunit beta